MLGAMMNLDIFHKMFQGFHSRDALLANFLLLVGLAMLGVGIELTQWTGIAAGAGLIVVGLEAHFLQAKAEKKNPSGVESESSTESRLYITDQRTYVEQLKQEIKEMEEAEGIVSDAFRFPDSLVQDAQRRAQRFLDEAEAISENRRSGADLYAREVLHAPGTQILLELEQCDQKILDDMPYIKDLLTSVAKQAGATVVGQSFHKFQPMGVTGILAIAESHICIHTWPEYAYAAVDIFTSGEKFKPHLAVELLIKGFHSKKPSLTEIKRGELADLAATRV